jgi:hypothetical protein
MATDHVVVPASETSWFGSRPRPVLLAVVGTSAALVVGVVAARDVTMAVGLLVVVATVVAVLLRPVVGAVLLVAVVPVTSGLSTGFPFPHVRLSEVVIGVVGLTIIVSTRRSDAVPWLAIDWALLAYGAGWAALAVAAAKTSGEHLSLADWGTVFGQLQFVLLYRGIRLAVRTPSDRRVTVGALVLASVPVAALAVLQEARVPAVAGFVDSITGGLAASGASASAGSMIRATGPFDNWAALAGYLLPILLVLAAVALAGLSFRHRRWFVAAGVLTAVALVCTAEQSAIVCVVVGVLVLAARYGAGRYRRAVRLGSIGLLVAAAAFLASRVAGELAGSPGSGRISWVPQTLSFRWSVWTGQYFPAIAGHLLTGYGVVTPSAIRWPYPESQYVAFLVEGGVVMLALFGVLAWAMLRTCGQARRSTDPLEQAMGRALTIATVALLAMNVLWPFLSNGGLPQVLWGLLALAAPGVVVADRLVAPPTDRAGPSGPADGAPPGLPGPPGPPALVGVVPPAPVLVGRR